MAVPTARTSDDDPPRSIPRAPHLGQLRCRRQILQVRWILVPVVPERRRSNKSGYHIRLHSLIPGARVDIQLLDHRNSETSVNRSVERGRYVLIGPKIT